MSGFGLFMGNHIRRGLAYRWVVLVPAVLVFALVTIFVTLQPDTYEAHAILMKPIANEPDQDSRRDAAQMASDAFRSASERLLGNSTLRKVIEQVDPYPELRETKSIDACIEELRKNLRIDVNRGARTITITCQHNQGDDASGTAQDVVKTLTSLFMEAQEEAIQKRIEKYAAFLDEEKRTLRQALERQQAALDEFKQIHANSLPSDVEANQAQIDRLQRDIFDYRGQMRGYNATLATLSREAMRLDADLKLIQEKGVEALIARTLQDLEARLADLEMARETATFKFAPDHENIKKLDHQIKAVKARIAKEKAKADKQPIEERKRLLTLMQTQNSAAVLATKGDVILLKKRIAQTQTDLQNAAERIATAARIEGRYTSLQRNLNEAMLAYNQVVERQHSASLRKRRENRDITLPIEVQQQAYAPAKPTGPDRLVTSLMGLAVGLGIGVALAIARHRLDTSFHRPDDLRALLPGAVLVTVPEVRTGGTRVGVMVVSILGGLVLAGIFAATVGILGLQVGWWGDPDLIRNLLMK